MLDDFHTIREIAELAELDELDELDADQQQVPQERFDPLLCYSDVEFLQRYRLSKECCMELLQNINPYLPQIKNRRGCPIPPSLQLFVTLHYMATGTLQLGVAGFADISQPTTSRCIRDISSAIVQLAPRYIKFPTPDEEEATMKEFLAIADMPGVIGTVDGTHIQILSPGGRDADLYRREYGFSLNVMGVCDASLRFTSVVVDRPGSVPDAKVFTESNVCERLEAGGYHGYLLGDGAYPCRPYLLTPFLEPNNDKERAYNTSHLKTRNTVQRAFCVLEKRFALLTQSMRTKLKVTTDIILACCILHNIAIENNIDIEVPDCIEADASIPFAEHEETNHVEAGLARRNEVANQYF